MADQDPNDLVYITHKNVDAVGGPVTRQAFEEVHKAKGWSLATADQVQAAESGNTDLTTKATTASTSKGS